MYNGCKVIALVPAAGMGQRMGIGQKKQYLLLKDKEILNWTLIHLLREPIIDEAIVIVPRDDVLEVEEKMTSWLSREQISTKISVIEGGATRQESVRKGLIKIEGDGFQTSFVVIHDGVRPFFPKNMLIRFLEALDHRSDIEGAIAGAEVTDTLKTINPEKVIIGTVDRSVVWSVQTPQVFRFDTLMKAHRYANDHAFEVTDDAAIIEAIGKKTVIIPCSSENIKITKPVDLIVAEVLLETYKVDL
ncbi:MAG TPA: 2-C-methyl-D-erythritol 4-phosphate cytidylyltransferase [Clostridiales bacterium UBA8960]|jgi:2-C-methyl-D-erythritol 4-phosphate cytidylyltransferase|nr:2-C-methyl-D-erythritol 4-phosphate cytidylyltransferase [Clostridiales bacterium UBA8960]